MLDASCRCDTARYPRCASADPQRCSIAPGTLDDDPPARPEQHVCAGANAPWDVVRDERPQHGAELTRDQA